MAAAKTIAKVSGQTKEFKNNKKKYKSKK